MFLLYIDNVISSPFESLQVKVTVFTLVVLLTVMILFAIIGWGFCCLQWHIKKHHQSSDLDGVSDSSRTSTDTMTNGKRVHFHGYNPLYTNSPSSPLITSPISIKTANNGVIFDTYVIDCSIPKNRQEMASSL